MKSMLFTLTVVGTLVMITNGSSGNHSFCHVAAVVARHCNGDDLPQRRLVQNIGPAGKRGQKGDKGDVGEQGSTGNIGAPGIVDYQLVNDTIQQMIRPALLQLDGRTQEISQMKSSLAELWNVMSLVMAGNCKVIQEDKCFWAIVHDNNDVTYASAETMCADEGSVMGNLYSPRHYRSVMKYLRTLRSSVFYIWTGMKINPATKAVTLSNDDPATFTKWEVGSPKSGEANTIIGLSIGPDPNDDTVGMFNDANAMTSSYYGVLCEKRV